MGQATEVYSKEFDSRFRDLPSGIRVRMIDAIRDLGRRLDSFSHQRLQGRAEFKLRVGNYRIIYRFDSSSNELFLVTVGHRREIYR